MSTECARHCRRLVDLTCRCFHAMFRDHLQALSKGFCHDCIKEDGTLRSGAVWS